MPPVSLHIGRVHDLAVGEPADVARDGRLHQRLGVGPEDLELAQRREVHDDGLLAAGPVFVERALVVEAGREPVAAVVDEPRVSAPVLGWNAVSFVSRGSASGVTRCAIATLKRFFAG